MVNLPPPEPNDQQPTGQSRDNDEAIAIAIALLSVGAILWWGWTRGGSFFTPDVGLPQLADSPSLVEDESLSGVASEEPTVSDTEDTAAEETGGRFGFLGGLFAFDNGEEADASDTETSEQSASIGAADDDAAVTADSSDRPTNNAASAAPTTTDADADDTGVSADPSDSAGEAATSESDQAATAEATDDSTEAATDSPQPGDEGGTEPAPLPELSISDVSEDYWAYPYIVSLFDAGLLPNFPSGTLQPDKELTRAELAALLNKSIVADAPSERSLTFSDVAPDYWAANDIEKVVDAGYMVGFPEGTFRPNEIVPRYQMFIAMVSGLELSPPADVDGVMSQYQGAESLPNWSRPQVAAAADQGMIVNNPDQPQLAPQAPATRADLIATIHQALVAQGKIEPIDTP